MMRTRSNNGFTLIELMVTITIMAIIAMIAAPTLQEFVDKTRLKGATDRLYADMQFARSEAVKRNSSVSISFSTGSNWCYGISAGGACNCSTANSCNIKTVSHSEFNGIALDSATFASSATTFNPVLGTLSSAGLARLQSSGGKQACVRMSVIGQVRLCSPAGSANLGGYPTCNC
jgi:prepilin-type N-terminal cleavage/methylation domain-containing protein